MKNIFAVLLVVSMVALFGCGGGGNGSGNGGGSAAIMSGTASQGSAIPYGTVVTVTDAKGIVKTTTVGDNGVYSIAVDTLTAPFLIKAGGYYSSANGAGVTNINPLTDLCVKAALGTSTIPTILPVTFPGQFTTSVNNILNSLNSMYPDTVIASKHFLDGDITLGAGVDLAFDYLTIVPPDASGAFSISSGTTPVLTGSVLSGSPVCTVTPAAMSILRDTVFPSTAQYGQVFTNAMVDVPGDSRFAYYTATGTYGSLILRHSDGTRPGTYNITPLVYSPMNDSTGVGVEVSDTGYWAINASGQLVLTNSSYTAMRGTVTTLTLTQVVGSNYTVIENTVNTTTNTRTNATLTLIAEPKFPSMATAMAGGRTIRYVTATGTGSIFCLENGTYSATDTTIGSGTWTTASGDLVLTSTSGSITHFGPVIRNDNGSGYGSYYIGDQAVGGVILESIKFVIF